MRQAEGVIKAAMKQMYGVIGTNTAAGYTVLDVRGANDSWNASPASRIIVRLPKGCVGQYCWGENKCVFTWQHGCMVVCAPPSQPDTFGFSCRDTQKLGSACAGLTQINDIACTVRLVGVAPTLAQLAVDSRSLAAQVGG